MSKLPSTTLTVGGMNLPQIHCSTTAHSNEQYKPLDLSTKPEFICESPPQKRNRYWFHPIEPLDLSVKERSEEKSFSENYEIASNETESSPFITSAMYQQKLSSIFQIRKSFSKFPEGDNMKITKCSNKSKAGEIQQHDSFLKNGFVKYEKYTKNEKRLDEEDIASQLKSTPTINYQDDSNETELEYITAGFSINDNEHIIDSNTSIHTIEKYNKSDQLKIQSKNSVKNLFAASPVVNEPQQQPVKQSENGENTIYEQLETKFQTNIFQPIQNCEDQDSLPPPGKSSVECFDQPYLRVTRKPKVEELKKSGESFIQDGKCFEVAPKLPRCRECSVALQESLGKTQLGSENVLCRFYAFRKLRYSSKGFLATAGFLDPHTDPSEEDLSLWQPASELPLQDLDVHMAQYLLTHVGDKFCDLCKQEEEAVSINMSEDKKAAWKRPVFGCREMCDVCNTTLFNYHWTCRTCGFAVCIDCYKARKGYMPEGFAVERPWLICVNKRAHDQEKMMLTQIIPAESLKNLEQKAHHIRTLLGLPLRCCGFSSTPQNIPYQRKGFFNEFSAEELKRESEKFEEKGVKIGNTETLYNADSNISNMFNSSRNLTNLSFEDYFSDKDKNRAKLFKDLGKRLSKHLDTTAPRHDPLDSFSSDFIPKDFVEEILSAVSQAAVDSANARLDCTEASIPTRVMTLTESRVLYPNCPHSWLCEGRLLKLSDPSHAGNYPLFQDQWKRGQPVLVSGVLKFLDKGLWEPDSFIQDFGDTKNDLVNCMTGRVIPGQYMCKFWEGFQEMSKMLRDEKGKPMLLKLKDWPPGEDFAEMLPSRFEDLMKALPMGEYTKRTGQLNLPSRLPSSFARPDLGPKMYIAYGSAIHPTKGTTNLHLDISDAVNVMVYVGVPKDIDRDQFINEAYRAVDEACFELLMRQRVREPSEVPGALWHIYSSRDAGKIRHLLTRVARERRIKLGPHQDPIHDQNWYLDGDLQERLFREYHVRGYAIVQCLGDAVFIPAGAPHQVRNLLNCIKVAEDFVSPENVSHCLHLTQEFRKLSDLHSNHEDKLQIKNIIYHTVKDSVTVLSSHK